MLIPYWQLSGFYFFYFAFVGAFTPYWSVYLAKLNYSPAEIGVLMSLLQVMRIFGPSLWGNLADRYEHQHLRIIQGATFLGVLSFCSFFIENHSFWFLFIMMSLLSFFWSASLPLVETITLAYLKLHDKSSHYSRIRVWGSIGFIIAVMGLGYAFDYMSIMWLIYWVLALKIGIFLFSFFIPKMPELSHHESTQEEHHSAWTILFQPTVLWVFIALLLMSVAHGPYYTFYSIYLVDHHYSKSVVGWMWAIGVICEVLVFIYMPQIMKRYSLERILTFSFIIAGIRFLMIAWGIETFAWVILAQTFHAFTFGTFHASAIALVHRYFSGKHQAKGQGLYISLTFGLGGTIGSLYSGMIWKSLGASWTFSIASIACFIGTIILFMTFKKQRNQAML